jgi:hypothetical protein
MKVVLAQRWSVGGRFYGPGEVEVSDSVHATLQRRGALDHPLAEYPALIKAGYKSLEEARYMSDEVLLRHEGVGPATIRKLRGEAEPEAEQPKPRFIGEKKRAAEE